MDSDDAHCPLCHESAVEAYLLDRVREYLRCSRCALVFVPKRFHVSSEAERAEYDLHQNDPGDVGYRKFLGRLANPLMARLTPGAAGLDFGCGPGPTLSVMLEEAGYAVDVYDLFYAREAEVFTKRYDFITATEVAEHLSDPKNELERLYSMLVPGGVLAIMTKLATTREAFSNWHYKNDKTHIAFFSRKTFEWLAERWNAELEFAAADVIFLGKPSG